VNRRKAATTVVAAIFAFGACGVPREAQPHVVRDRDVPFDLLDAGATAPPTSTSPARAAPTPG
jgi:hypothetical protein